MGRMLDALKNLENDPGATLAVSPPAEQVGAASSSASQVGGANASTPASTSALKLPPPAASPATPGGTSSGAAFLATLTSSPAAMAAASPDSSTASPTPQSSTLASAAATLARLKATAPPVRTNAAPLPTASKPAVASVAAPVVATVVQPAIAPAADPVTPALLPEAVRPPQAQIEPAPVDSLPPAAPEIVLPARRSTLTRLEETVQAALADPRRSVPLEQLARRMRSELRSDSGRCWMLADAGGHHDSADLAAHLGAIFASQLGDVLLIDGSLDCALLSAGLNAIDRPGLAQTATEGSKAWQNLIQPTSWEHLFLLPAGQVVSGMPDPTSAWTNLLSQAERRFRLVLVDGGPAAEPTCKALGRICDATYLVIRLGVTEARQARWAMQQLRTGGARVIGSIATSVPSLESLR